MFVHSRWFFFFFFVPHLWHVKESLPSFPSPKIQDNGYIIRPFGHLILCVCVSVRVQEKIFLC